jgi:hypothetical protein
MATKPQIPRTEPIGPDGKLGREWGRWFFEIFVYLDNLSNEVSSIFGRTGVVVAAASDYDASQVDNDSGVSGAFVDDALDTLAAADAAALLPKAGGEMSGNITMSSTETVDGRDLSVDGAKLDKMFDPSTNAGTAGTNVTATEYGDAHNHVTVLTLGAVALTPNIPADTEGAGAVIYTFPAGVYVVTATHMDITSGSFGSNTNAADLGIGSLISSGDIATLTTAAMEDYVTGQTVANVSSFVKEKSTIMTAGAPLLFEAGGSHVVNVNVAGIWTPQ